MRLQQIGSFDEPLYVTAPPGDASRVFVVEQGGAIRVVKDGKTLGTPFLDISGLVQAGSEQGLLSMAFAPDYATSGLFYVYYTDKDRDQRVVEYRRRSDDDADPGSARVVLRMADSEPNHNGGLLLFGPDACSTSARATAAAAGTSTARAATGSRSARCWARSCASTRARAPAALLGAAREPIRGRAGAKGEIYSYGLRNPGASRSTARPAT